MLTTYLLRPDSRPSDQLAEFIKRASFAADYGAEER
jgi:hypothetical protein